MHSSTPVEDRHQRSRDTGNSNNPLLLVNAQDLQKTKLGTIACANSSKKTCRLLCKCFHKKKQKQRFFLIAALVMIALHTIMYRMRSTTRSFLLNHHSSPSPLNDDFFSQTAKELFHIFLPPLNFLIQFVSTMQKCTNN